MPAPPNWGQAVVAGGGGLAGDERGWWEALWFYVSPPHKTVPCLCTRCPALRRTALQHRGASWPVRMREVSPPPGQQPRQHPGHRCQGGRLRLTARGTAAATAPTPAPAPRPASSSGGGAPHRPPPKRHPIRVKWTREHGTRSAVNGRVFVLVAPLSAPQGSQLQLQPRIPLPHRREASLGPVAHPPPTPSL